MSRRYRLATMAVATFLVALWLVIVVEIMSGCGDVTYANLTDYTVNQCVFVPQ